MWKKTYHITVQAEHEGVNIIETTYLKREIDEPQVAVGSTETDGESEARARARIRKDNEEHHKKKVGFLSNIINPRVSWSGKFRC